MFSGRAWRASPFAIDISKCVSDDCEHDREKSPAFGIFFGCMIEGLQLLDLFGSIGLLERIGLAYQAKTMVLEKFAVAVNSPFHTTPRLLM
jgi:hypothetical protein